MSNLSHPYRFEPSNRSVRRRYQRIRKKGSVPETEGGFQRNAWNGANSSFTRNRMSGRQRIEMDDQNAFFTRRNAQVPRMDAREQTEVPPWSVGMETACAANVPGQTNALPLGPIGGNTRNPRKVLLPTPVLFNPQVPPPPINALNQWASYTPMPENPPTPQMTWQNPLPIWTYRDNSMNMQNQQWNYPPPPFPAGPQPPPPSSTSRWSDPNPPYQSNWQNQQFNVPHQATFVPNQQYPNPYWNPPWNPPSPQVYNPSNQNSYWDQNQNQNQYWNARETFEDIWNSGIPSNQQQGVRRPAWAPPNENVKNRNNHSNKNRKTSGYNNSHYDRNLGNHVGSMELSDELSNIK